MLVDTSIPEDYSYCGCPSGYGTGASTISIKQDGNIYHTTHTHRYPLSYVKHCRKSSMMSRCITSQKIDLTLLGYDRKMLVNY